ncbi:hypothetical protein V6N13_059928 [Hibiscus sabdariffa]
MIISGTSQHKSHCPGNCRVVGSVLIVMGLYSVLWGKHKESKEKENEMEMEDEPIKAIRANGNTTLVIGDIEANRVLQLQKNEANEKLSNNGKTRSSSTLPLEFSNL